MIRFRVIAFDVLTFPAYLWIEFVGFLTGVQTEIHTFDDDNLS